MSDSRDLTFTDIVDGREVRVAVRSVEGGVGLTLSKKSHDDLEVFMPPDALDRLLLALREAPWD